MLGRQKQLHCWGLWPDGEDISSEGPISIQWELRQSAVGGMLAVKGGPDNEVAMVRGPALTVMGNSGTGAVSRAVLSD